VTPLELLERPHDRRVVAHAHLQGEAQPRPAPGRRQAVFSQGELLFAIRTGTRLPAVNAPTPRSGDAYVQSFARGLSVIRAFSAERPAMTVSEVAAAAGLTRAGARRILLTLAQLGYVTAQGRQFRLTARILDLGFAYLSSMPFWGLAEPIMEEL